MYIGTDSFQFLLKGNPFLIFWVKSNRGRCYLFTVRPFQLRVYRSVFLNPVCGKFILISIKSGCASKSKYYHTEIVLKS